MPFFTNIPANIILEKAGIDPAATFLALHRTPKAN
jgi:hypothetical protein